MVNGEDDVKTKVEIPPPCDDTDFLSADCSREITGAKKVLKLSYWVTLVDNVPTFQATYYIKYKFKSTHKKYDLRLCLEFAEDGKELEERAQMMLHGDKIYTNKVFADGLKVLDSSKA